MSEEKIEIENCELCIIGLGVSGLNALFSSSQYLSRRDRVIVVDKNNYSNAIGGMWNNTYSFVRLHQPHPLFTVGNMKWKWNKPPSHLATKSEVVQHFKHCYNELKNKMSIIEKFNYEYMSHEEIKLGEKYEVHITFKSLDFDLPNLLVKSKRCIKAFGLNVKSNLPLEFETDKVHSIVPENLLLDDDLIQKIDTPVYIVGGGKTSMDVGLLLLKHNPKIELNYIVGKGTYFLNRDLFFPNGINKYWGGITISEFLLHATMIYKENELERITEHIVKEYGLDPFGGSKSSLFGLLSSQELKAITRGKNQHFNDYLSDVIEENNELLIKFRSGNTLDIKTNSWFINCTGYIFPKEERSEHILSPHGTVLSINKATSALIFSSLGGYFLTHLWFLDRFKETEIYEFDHVDLIKKDKRSFFHAVSAQTIHNLLSIIESLPLKAVLNCGLNFDKWYPLHRQLSVFIKLLQKKQKYKKHSSEVLENICKKYSVYNGLIGHNNYK